MATDAIRISATENIDAGDCIRRVRYEPLFVVVGIDLRIATIPKIHVLPTSACRLRGWRPIALGSSNNCAGVIQVLGKRNELGHRSQRLIQTIELICTAAGSSGQISVSVQRTVNPTIVGEIHYILKAGINLKRDRVLRGMHHGDRTASVSVSEIQKRGVGRSTSCIGIARRKFRRDFALIKVDGPGI